MQVQKRMKIILNTEFLKKKDLSPNEFVSLYMIFHSIKYDHDDWSIKSLQTKDWIDVDRRIIDQNMTENFFNQPANLKEWMISWIKMWPSFMMPGGYRVSGNTLSCIKKMDKFIKEFPEYPQDIIIKATENYLKKQEQMGWKYTKKNAKFILDSDGSVLEQECQDILDGNDYSVKSNVVSM